MAATQDKIILILAAGESSRMGQPKQLLPWGNTTLLNHAIQTATQCSPNISVILGANAELIKNSISENDAANFYINKNWKKGMGSTIVYGIKQVVSNATTHKIKSCLILLADQPLVDSEFLTKLWDTFENINPKIVATDYGNSIGVPAIFSSKYFSELGKLTGKEGAKSVLKKFKKDVYSISGNNKIVDIDTPEEYQIIINNIFK